MNLLTVSLLLLGFSYVTPESIILDGTGPLADREIIFCPSKDICPRLICGPSFITAYLKTAELINYKVDILSPHLEDRNCRGFPIVDDSVVVQWRVGLGECGNRLYRNETHAEYKNYIHLLPNPANIIYREEIVINVSCVYPLNYNTSLGTVLWPVISYTYIIVDGYGEFKVVMALYKDVSYLTPHQGTDLQISTEETLYVGVFIAEGDTDSFNLVMENCFATPTNNWNDPVKFFIIRNKCPYSGDGTIRVYSNGLSSFGQFSIQMFKFIGDYNRVYLHCEVSLCYKRENSCVPTCPPPGPVVLVDPDYRSYRSLPQDRGYLSLGSIDRSDFPDNDNDHANGDAGKTTNWNMMTLVGFILTTYLFL